MIINNYKPNKFYDKIVFSLRELSARLPLILLIFKVVHNLVDWRYKFVNLFQPTLILQRDVMTTFHTILIHQAFHSKYYGGKRRFPGEEDANIVDIILKFILSGYSMSTI